MFIGNLLAAISAKEFVNQRVVPPLHLDTPCGRHGFQHPRLTPRPPDDLVVDLIDITGLTLFGLPMVT